MSRNDTGLVGDDVPSIHKSNMPTEKQVYLISEIYKYLNIPFNGNTSKQAYNFINSHYSDVRKIRGI